jgi:hypothetical protein
MKLLVFFVLALLVFNGCSTDETASQSTTSETVTHDTLSILEKERLVWRYFQRVEKEVGSDLGISKDTLEARIQKLIDEGHIAKPIVFYVTKNGWEPKALDYKSYKAYRADHPINAAVPLVLESDTAAYEDLRNDLRRVLAADSLSRIRGQ